MAPLALITGITGFIGRTLEAHLHKQGIDCVGICRRPRSCTDAICMNLETEPSSIATLLATRRPDFIFHLASSTEPGSAIFAANILPLKHLLDGVETVPGYTPRIVVVGSAAEYGDLGPEPVVEASRELPLSAYGIAKLAQTRLALARRRSGLDILVVRIFNVLGPGMSRLLGPARFVQLARQTRASAACEIRVGDLTTVRDYLDVEDVARGLWILAQNVQNSRDGLVNLCSGTGIRMHDVLDEVLRQLGLSVRPTPDPAQFRRSTEISVSIGSTARLRTLTTETFSLDLRRSVARLLAASEC